MKSLPSLERSATESVSRIPDTIQCLFNQLEELRVQIDKLSVQLEPVRLAEPHGPKEKEKPDLAGSQVFCRINSAIEEVDNLSEKVKQLQREIEI